jgi:hypothetical protein
MLTATITITINEYRPLGSVFPICAKMTMPKTHGINFDGESIIVNEQAPTELTFKIPSNKYVLLGISFAANQRKKGRTNLGQGEFPKISITRSFKTGSSLTVLDENETTIPFNYVLLVQSASDGSIGVIDPTIRYEPE